MIRRNPPRVATWILEHFALADRNEALAGDLLEEFRAGRSNRWYWRQVVSAIAIGSLRGTMGRLDVLLFALFWSMLTPAWLLAFVHLEQRFSLEQRLWQMDWPWSTVCDLGLLLAANLIFTWAGIALYLIPHLSITKNLRLRALVKGLLASVPVLVTLWAALIVLPMRFISQSRPADRLASIPMSSSRITRIEPLQVTRVPYEETWIAQYGPRAVVHEDSALKAVADFRISTMFVRLPFFLCVVFALWGTAPKSARTGRIAM
ncbi:MAG TPA: hypothetical protein VMU48_03410 [Terracidiphilus sp.]|nr:hypothetical protein [Terracidiphilus sp.]